MHVYGYKILKQMNSKQEYIAVVKRLIHMCICVAYAKLIQTPVTAYLLYNSKCIYVTYAKHIQIPIAAYLI